jgi:thioesterase domain-containing protein
MNQPVETTEQLSADDRRRLLAEMLQKKAIRAPERPLSLGQERLWLMTRLDPDSFRYNIAVAYRLVGALDLTALEQAVLRIAERHEVLRATFTAGKGQPVQRIGRDVPGVFAVTELSDLPADRRTARAARLAVEEAKRPFDLAKGPLWRVKVLRNSHDDHVIVVVMHHIVSDAWSFFVFGQELTELYDASIAGRPPRLTDLPINYADFGQRQRQWLSGQVYEQQLAHWRNHLEGNVPRLLLPTDRPGAAAINHRGAFQTLAIPATLSQQLGQLCRRESTTMFMTLLAAFEVLMHQYSGQEDLILCTPASGRHRSQTKELIGYFNNILPMRFDLRGDPTFAEVVRRTRKVTLDAFKFQDLPFQVIADSPNLKAVSLNRVLFSLDIEWPPKLTLAGLRSEAWAVRTETADFDLSVSLWLDRDEIRGVFEFKTELFNDDTIARMIADYCELLKALAENPEIAMSSLPSRAKPDAELRMSTAGRNAPKFKPPRSAIELKIVTEWEDILGIRPIGVDDDLLELGATSLAVARLSERLQGMFPVALPLAAIFQARTVSRITALVQEGGSAPAGPALAPLRPSGTHPPLFLCEGIGIYYALTRHLASEQPVYSLVTEVGGDDPSIEDRAASYIAQVRTVQPEGPYYLAGLSFGGIVAFEMAQQFRAAGQEVALLALFDTPTPWAFRPNALPKRLAGHLSNLRRFGFSYVEKKVGRRLKRLKRALRVNGPVAAPASATLADTDRLRQLLSTTADRYSLRTYPGRATLFVLAERDGMSDSLFDPALGEVDRELGWGRVVAGGVEVHEMAGEHTSILREPNVQILAGKLTSCLETARAAAST